MKVWIARDEMGHLGAYKEYPRLRNEFYPNNDKKCYWPNPCTPEHPSGISGHIALDLDEDMLPDVKFEDGPIEMEMSFTRVANDELTPIPEDIRLGLQITSEGMKAIKL